MSEQEGTTRGLELLLQEPEIIAWLGDYRPQPDETAAAAVADDDEPPQAA